MQNFQTHQVLTGEKAKENILVQLFTHLVAVLHQQQIKIYLLHMLMYCMLYCSYFFHFNSKIT